VGGWSISGRWKRDERKRRLEGPCIRNVPRLGQIGAGF